MTREQSIDEILGEHRAEVLYSFLDADKNASHAIISLFESLINEVIGEDDYIGFKMPLEPPYEIRVARNDIRRMQRAKAKQLLKELK